MKKSLKTVALILLISVIVGIASVVIQFGYNMLFVGPVAYETTKGGDGKLTDMLYYSDTLEDSYFLDTETVSNNLEGALERIDKIGRAHV